MTASSSYPPPADDDDPPPPAPVLPDLDECCGQGCEPCIFDLYEAAQERHRNALQAWQARRLAREGGTPEAASEPSPPASAGSG